MKRISALLIATILVMAASPIPVAPQNGGTGVNNPAGATLTLAAPLGTTGTGTKTFAFPAGTFSYTFPGASVTLDYKSGSWVTGHCLQAADTTGGISDAGAACGAGGSVTWPAATDLVISAGVSSNPTGLAPINGDCVVGSGGAWTAAACPGGGGIAGPGTTTNGFVPVWNGTTGSALAAGFAINAGAQAALANALNGSGGLLGFSIIGTSGGALGLLNTANTYSAVQFFNDGDLALKGSSSGSSIFHAPATGGGAIQLPAGSVNLDYQVGSFVSGHCLQASGTAGGIADSGSTNCGGGGGSVSFTVDPTTPNLVFTPSPATGTAVLKSASPSVTSASSTYTFNGTGTSGTGAAIDNTSTILLTAASPTFALGVAGATDFAPGVGGIVMADGTTPLTITSSSTICGQASPVSFDARQPVSFAAGSGDWKCAIGFPAAPPAGTIASGKNVGLDSSGKIVVATIAAGGNVSNSGTPTANQLATWVDATHVQGVTTGSGVVAALGNNLSAPGGVTSTIASGTSAMGTSAISSATCATAVTTTATNTATTDVVQWGFNGDPTAVTGYAPVTTGALTIFAYPSANNVNFKVCNLTTASVTPGAITLNWRIAR